jgi:kumamolisin
MKRSIQLATFAVLCFFCSTLIGSSQTVSNGLKTFNNSIVPVPSGTAAPAAMSDESRNRKLVIHFALETSNLKELQDRVLRGETISPSEMKTKYSGNPDSLQKLITWLKGQNFEIVRTSKDNTSVYAKASVSQIEKSLGSKMVNVTYKGITTPAAATPPKMPLEAGQNVIAIDGLQPFVRAVKHTVTRESYLKKRNSSKVVPSKNASARPTYKVDDILNAYNAKSLSANGEGQMIAILIDTFPDINDLKLFWKKNGINDLTKQIVLTNVQGASLPPQEGEETLDSEWTGGIAPHAVINVYASGGLEFELLDRALERIYEDALANEGLRSVSISLGLREDKVSSGEIQIEHALFVKLSAIGVSVFVSSGDAGSNPDVSGHDRGSDPVVEFQASDPFTISVGGTSLVISSGKVRSELGWEDSGGGVSNIFQRSPWQPAYSPITGSGRLVPDVSAVADPDPGAFVWFQGKEWPVGGTSWSTPIWASFNALIADYRKRMNKQPVGFLGPILYRLPSKAFRDITEGKNGQFSCGRGWDPVTGLGTPDLKAIADAIK